MSEQIDVNASGLESQIPISNISQQEICKMVQTVASAMEKNTHFRVLSRLPMDVRKRLRALRKLQLQTNAIEMEFHEKEFQLEKEFQAKHQEIYKKRFEIITGLHEPNDAECDIPDLDTFKRDENSGVFTELLKRQDAETGAGEVDPDINVEAVGTKGVPNFWFQILYSNPSFDYLVHKDDEPILHHLIDIRTIYNTEPHFSFTLEFEFSPNPFFENKVLTKQYLLKMKCEDMCYEGPSIYKTIGCDIIWKTEKGTRPSIFDFFNPPVLPDVLHPSYEEIKNILQDDFEIGDYVKDNIVPQAVLYFTGERDDNEEEDSLDSKSEDDGSQESSASDVEDQFEGEKPPK